MDSFGSRAPYRAPDDGGKAAPFNSVEHVRPPLPGLETGGKSVTSVIPRNSSKIIKEAFRMGDVIYACFIPKTTDGGKGRMRARRQRALAISAREILAQVDDLVMDHADPAYTAPEHG
jgi:hypothetical protein